MSSPNVQPSPRWLAFAAGLLMFLTSSSPVSAKVPIPKIYRDLFKQDPLGNRDLRGDIPGAYRSPFGIQVHENCFKVGARLTGMKRPEMVKKFEELFEYSTRQFASECPKRYPELSPYIREWIAQARRAFITCTADPDLAHRGAYAAGGYTEAFSRLESEARTGLKNTGLVPLARIHRPGQVLAPDHLLMVLKAENGFSPRINYVFIHEILHMTSANNAIDHSDLETWREGRSLCEKSALDDRMSIVSEVCMPQGDFDLKGQSMPGLTLEAVLGERIRQCGIERACVQPMTNRMSDNLLEIIYERYAPSLPLNRIAAQRFCSRVLNRHYCQMMVRRGGKALIRNSQPIREAFEPIRKKLDEILPRARNHIPAALLREFPAHEAGLQAWRSSPCFGAAFTVGSDGSLYTRAPIEEQVALTSKSERAQMLIESYHWLRHVGQALARSSRCTGQARYEFGKVFMTFGNDLAAFRDWTYFDKWMKPRYAGNTEELEELRHQPVYLEPSKVPPSIQRIFGEKELTGYIQALRVHHPHSIDFDCESTTIPAIAGLKDLFTAKRVLSSGTGSSGPGCTR